MIRFLLCAGLVLGAGCGRKGLSEPMAETRTLEYRACESAEQCVYTHNGCCDCANGGTDIAVRREKLAAFRAQFSCAGVGCTEMEGACGQGRVACEGGRCVYRDAPP
jgi:hypothetical protein